MDTDEQFQEMVQSLRQKQQALFADNQTELRTQIEFDNKLLVLTYKFLASIGLMKDYIDYIRKQFGNKGIESDGKELK